MGDDTIRLYYTGRGYYPGVPQRDLTDADLRRLSAAKIEAVTAKHPKTGRAVYQVTEPADRQVERAPRVGPGDDLNALTVPQLRALATARNVTVSAKARKADLLAALNGEPAGGTEPVDEGESSPPPASRVPGDEPADEAEAAESDRQTGE